MSKTRLILKLTHYFPNEQKHFERK